MKPNRIKALISCIIVGVLLQAVPAGDAVNLARAGTVGGFLNNNAAVLYAPSLLGLSRENFVSLSLADMFHKSIANNNDVQNYNISLSGKYNLSSNIALAMQWEHYTVVKHHEEHITLSAAYQLLPGLSGGAAVSVECYYTSAAGINNNGILLDITAAASWQAGTYFTLTPAVHVRDLNNKAIAVSPALYSGCRIGDFFIGLDNTFNQNYEYELAAALEYNINNFFIPRLGVGMKKYSFGFTFKPDFSHTDNSLGVSYGLSYHRVLGMDNSVAVKLIF